MSLRSVIILNNDKAHLWSNDPLLGQKIMNSVNEIHKTPHIDNYDNYGKVVQCVHEDNQTLAYIHRKDVFIPIAGAMEWCDEFIEDDILNMIRIAARSKGYRLVKNG